MAVGLMECPVDEQGWAVRESEAIDVKTRMNHTWSRLLEVIGENPEKTIADFIEYSKSANIRRFSLRNRFFLFCQCKASRQQTIVCRDARGVRTGTVEIMKNGDAVFRNRKGVRVGTARVMGNRTVFYDRSGRRTGEMSGASFPLLGCGGTGP